MFKINIDVNSRMDYTNCGSQDIIIVEYGENEKDFLFEIKKIEYKESTCPGCNDKAVKMLMFPCSCKEVFINYFIIKLGLVLLRTV